MISISIILLVAALICAIVSYIWNPNVMISTAALLLCVALLAGK